MHTKSNPQNGEIAQVVVDGGGTRATQHIAALPMVSGSWQCAGSRAYGRILVSQAHIALSFWQ